MINLIGKAFSYISSLLNKFQVKQFLAVALVGFVLLTTNVNTGRGQSATFKQINDKAHQIDSERPKTTREWQKEARETEGDLGDRLQNITEESGQAVKEWGGLYPDTAKRSTRELRENTAR
jgi:hypothetical protein